MRVKTTTLTNALAAVFSLINFIFRLCCHDVLYYLVNFGKYEQLVNFRHANCCILIRKTAEFLVISMVLNMNFKARYQEVSFNSYVQLALPKDHI